MGGHGYGYGYGLGSWGMWGDADNGLDNLNLSADQHNHIGDIQGSICQAMWQLMGTVHEQGCHMRGTDSTDEPEARESFTSMAESRQAVFELQLETRKNRRCAEQRTARPVQPRAMISTHLRYFINDSYQINKHLGWLCFNP